LPRGGYGCKPYARPEALGVAGNPLIIQIREEPERIPSGEIAT
jgi:hypothetical protein